MSSASSKESKETSYLLSFDIKEDKKLISDIEEIKEVETLFIEVD